MDLSIVIINWNTCDLLNGCLTSIYTHPPLCKFEVWVVDNASTDGSSTMVKHYFPQVHLINNPVNSGFAHANNLAIRQTVGRYVLMLNSDTLVKPGALQSLVEFMDKVPEAGGCGARILNPDGSLQVSCYVHPTLVNEVLRMFHLDNLSPKTCYRMFEWEIDKTRAVDVIQGACLMLRKSVLDQVGLLDEDFFMYSEDYDLCFRIRKGNWSLFWVPWSEVIHYGGQSTSQVAADMFLWLYQSKLLWMRKHYGKFSANLYKLILLSSTLLRLFITPLSFLERPQTRQRHLSLSQNYRRLLTTLPDM